MKKSKLSRSGDRLSGLSDSLIFDIFWFLPITDVVRTTILCKRWRNLWTNSPFLNFSDSGLFNYRVEGTLDKFRNFCNRALLLWRGAKLLKFKVMCRYTLSISLAGDINVWVRFAKEKEVRELYLDLCYPHEDGVMDAELESVWSCSSLEVLSMEGCCPLSIGNGNVKWDRLKSLTIFTNRLRQDLLSKVLCGSPNLEVFILEYVDRGENFCIQSTTLKKLSIEKRLGASTYVRNPEMKIQTPNLERLEISGVPFSKFSIDLAPLTDVTLGFYCLENCNYGESETPKFLDTKGALVQILPAIQHVESLTLSECCLEVLGAMNKKSLLSPLSKVKFLNASSRFGSSSKHIQIAGLLQIFPKLKRLVIKDKYEDEVESEDDDEDGYQDDRESLEFEANLPNSFLLELRTVEVTWAECDQSIFAFIKTLLKYASKLEKMVFRGNGFMPPSSPSYSLFLASQKLLKMPRSSPTAQLIFCEH